MKCCTITVIRKNSKERHNATLQCLTPPISLTFTITPLSVPPWRGRGRNAMSAAPQSSATQRRRRHVLPLFVNFICTIWRGGEAENLNLATRIAGLTTVASYSCGSNTGTSPQFIANCKWDMQAGMDQASSCCDNTQTHIETLDLNHKEGKGLHA